MKNQWIINEDRRTAWNFSDRSAVQFPDADLFIAQAVAAGDAILRDYRARPGEPRQYYDLILQLRILYTKKLTPIELGFFQQILADLSNPLPWDIYADWLEEQGNYLGWEFRTKAARLRGKVIEHANGEIEVTE